MTAVQWRLVHGGTMVGPFTERKQMDRMVDGLRDKWAAGDLDASVVTVQVTDGQGWIAAEVIDFAHETNDDEETAA